jgi:hypothetical protein
MFSAYFFLKVHLHHFSKIKKVKKMSQNSRSQGFSYYFRMMIEGSGYRKPKNIRIRIRILIHNTGKFQHTKATINYMMGITSILIKAL